MGVQVRALKIYPALWMVQSSLHDTNRYNGGCHLHLTCISIVTLINPKTGIGEVIAIFWTINVPPGLHMLILVRG